VYAEAVRTERVHLVVSFLLFVALLDRKLSSSAPLLLFVRCLDLFEREVHMPLPGAGLVVFASRLEDM
jgi:hypothetical protein